MSQEQTQDLEAAVASLEADRGVKVQISSNMLLVNPLTSHPAHLPCQTLSHP